MVHAFICSKPFQLVSILNLPYNFEEKGIKRILYILNHFPGAKEVAEKVLSVFPYWDNVFVLQERYQLTTLLKKNKVHTLYTDIDTGKTTYRWSLVVKEMNVYEEGTQNYRSIRADYIKYPSTTKIRELITPLLGWGAYLGSNRKTNHVFLYNPDYIKTNLPSIGHKVGPLKMSLYSFLEANLDALSQLFPIPEDLTIIQNEKVAIYITSHFLNMDVLEKLKADASLYDRVIIKVHPHILYQTPHLMEELKLLPFQVLTGNFLAEILFMYLLKNNNTISIFHESSTACLYLKENEQVKIFDYRQGEYRNFYKNLRDCYLTADYTYDYIGHLKK